MLHLVEHVELAEPWTGSVDEKTMKVAIELSRYFTEHALVAFGPMGVAGRLRMAADLWEVVKQHEWRQFSRRDLHQAIRHRYAVEDVAAGLTGLEEMGYIRPMAAPAQAWVARRLLCMR